MTSLSGFIPRLAERIKPILKIKKKNTITKWEERCEVAFAKVKKVLASLPIMARPAQGHELKLYIVVTDATISATLIQEALEFKLIYVLSRVLQDPEKRY